MDQSFYRLNQWFKTQQGERLSLYIHDALSHCLPNLRGNFLVQLGIEEFQGWLNQCQIENQVIALPFAGTRAASVVAQIPKLPFDSRSIDVVFCPFTFGLVKHRFALMDEIDRILAPHGFLLSCQVNPFSWWGVPWHSTAPLIGKSNISALTMRKMVQNRGYYVHSVHRFVYWPPLVNKLFWEKMFEKMGQMILPSPHGFYLMCAQKNTFQPLKCVTPMFYERGFSPW